jgi:hypothetical protein
VSTTLYVFSSKDDYLNENQRSTTQQAVGNGVSPDAENNNKYTEKRTYASVLKSNVNNEQVTGKVDNERTQELIKLK